MAKDHGGVCDVCHLKVEYMKALGKIEIIEKKFVK